MAKVLPMRVVALLFVLLSCHPDQKPGEAASPARENGTAATSGFDLIIRGGDVLDGTGARAVRADVGIRGDTIAAVEHGQLDLVEDQRLVRPVGQHEVEVQVLRVSLATRWTRAGLADTRTPPRMTAGAATRDCHAQSATGTRTNASAAAMRSAVDAERRRRSSRMIPCYA
jgi:hypothetical protein